METPAQRVEQHLTQQNSEGVTKGGLRAVQGQSPRKPETPNTQPKKLNWAEVTKLNLQQAREIIPEPLQAKISKTRSLLTQNSVKPAYEPRPTALYFKNVRRGPLGVIRKALRECLPTWALLGLDFVGNSIMEVVTDDRLKARVIATMKLMGILNVPDLDVFESALRTHKTDDPNNERKMRNLTAAVRRFEKNTERAKNQWAVAWYKAQLEQAKMRLQSVANTVQPQTTDGVTRSGNLEAPPARQLEEEEWTTVTIRNRGMKNMPESRDGNSLQTSLLPHNGVTGSKGPAADPEQTRMEPTQDEIMHDK